MVKLYLLAVTVALSACASKARDGNEQEPNKTKVRELHWMHGRAYDA